MADGELWRTLEIGDQFRIVHLPYEFSECDYSLHDETREAYRHLIDSLEVLRVVRIDDEGFPWTEFTIKDENQQIEYHTLMINHDRIVITNRAD